MSAREVNDAFCWLAGMRVDADGSPRAYAAPGSGQHGLDALGNAGEDGNWFGVVTDNGRKDGKPVVQANGFLVSPSSLVDHSITDPANPARYVDAETVPYISIPSDMLAGSHGGPLHVGDLAVVVYRGKVVPCIVADVGPRGKFGEASIATAVACGIPSSPRNGGCSAGVLYIVFPGSAASPAWPRSNEDIAEAAMALFNNWGGVDLAALTSSRLKTA